MIYLKDTFRLWYFSCNCCYSRECTHKPPSYMLLYPFDNAYYRIKISMLNYLHHYFPLCRNILKNNFKVLFRFLGIYMYLYEYQNLDLRSPQLEYHPKTTNRNKIGLELQFDTKSYYSFYFQKTFYMSRYHISIIGRNIFVMCIYHG